MERTCSHTGPAWPTKHGGNVRSPTIAALRRIVCQKIKAAGNEIDELKFCHRPHAHQACAARCADDRSFRNRGIDYTLFSKMIDEPFSDFESAAINADVFADHE